MDDEFENAIQKIKAKTGSNERDRLYEIIGLLILLGGAALTFIAYFVAGSQNSGNVSIDTLEHNEHIILAIFGVALSVVGGFIYLRFSIGRFLRFWLLRQIHENSKPSGN
tara:strand:- start:1326 stop:1655 length:330 start_codon:yes stop_codon:yes gene_type:complete